MSCIQRLLLLWLRTQEEQRRLYTTLKGDASTRDLPVVVSSLANLRDSPGKLGDLSPYLDFGNMHPYAAGQPPSRHSGWGLSMERTIAEARKVSGDKPILATECGYHNRVDNLGMSAAELKAYACYCLFTMNRRQFLKHLGAASVAVPPFAAMQLHAVASNAPAARTFLSRLQPAVVGGGFELEDYWVWCGAPIRGEDGRYHLFASRVPKEFPFHPHWLFHSEIVRAEAEKPVGPYRFAEVALPPRGGDFFDARSTHNPHIRKVGDTFLLLYMGTNYDGPTPSRDNPEVWRSPRYLATWARKRIGLATSKSVRGPWKRLDQPLIEPRPGEWDSIATTNPSLCPLPDGSFLLAYKSRKENLGQLQVGVAHGPHYTGPWKRQPTPWLFRGKPAHLEDPFLWYEDGRVQALMKDMSGEICGEKFAGVHVTSADGLNWDFGRSTLAYRRTVRWSDGRTTEQAFLERPQLLIQNGVPTHLFCATAEGPGADLKDATRTRNIVFPIFS